MTATVIVRDATHGNIGSLPPGRAAGYSTGSGDVPWNDADWKSHPGAVRICQNPAATDHTADVLDVEKGAATIADVAPWSEAAAANFNAVTRPGQRMPAIYCSRSNVTTVVNALVKGGITSGVGLWVADWNNDEVEAAAEVANASGPFPVIGRQYRNAGLFDVSVFSLDWLNNMSVTPPVKPKSPPGQWNESGWTWKDVTVLGVGLDGKLHAFVFDGEAWTKVK